jgi:hypothetical protein
MAANVRNCIECKLDLPLTEYRQYPTGNRRKRCRGCCRKQSKECKRQQRKDHPHFERDYYQKTIEKRRECARNHYRRNSVICKIRAAEYRAKKRNRMVSWADENKIKEIYKNCPDGYHVDHIIPLNGNNVSGLHIETNLQYLTKSENHKKRNKWVI